MMSVDANGNLYTNVFEKNFKKTHLGGVPLLFCLSSCRNFAKGEIGFLETCWVVTLVVTERRYK